MVIDNNEVKEVCGGRAHKKCRYVLCPKHCGVMQEHQTFICPVDSHKSQTASTSKVKKLSPNCKILADLATNTTTIATTPSTPADTPHENVSHQIEQILKDQLADESDGEEEVGVSSESGGENTKSDNNVAISALATQIAILQKEIKALRIANSHTQIQPLVPPHTDYSSSSDSESDSDLESKKPHIASSKPDPWSKANAEAMRKFVKENCGNIVTAKKIKKELRIFIDNFNTLSSLGANRTAILAEHQKKIEKQILKRQYGPKKVKFLQEASFWGHFVSIPKHAGKPFKWALDDADKDDKSPKNFKGNNSNSTCY